MAAFKRVRYGTALKPFVAQKVCAQFPSRSKFPPVDPATLTSGARPFGSLKALSPRCDQAATSIVGYPSISTVNGATDNLSALYHWQFRKIHELGVDGFNTFMVNRLASGRVFHSVVESLLQELMNTGKITSTAEEILMRREVSAKYADRLTGYLTGVREYLCSLKSSPLMRLEKSTYHPILCYNGRFDAIVEIDGELTLVDWKTVNSESQKSREHGDKLISDLYSNPVQIAAYVAAVNADPSYSFLPPICRAAVVLAYEDGRSVEVVPMNKDDIEQYFDEFCYRLNKFWWTVENGPMRADYVSFVYNPSLLNNNVLSNVVVEVDEAMDLKQGTAKVKELQSKRLTV